MSAVGKVLIVGGGIGGLTRAVAMGRHGLAADVVEIKPRHDVYGVGIVMLEEFMRRRYERCRFVQNLSHQIGEEGALTAPEQCRRRDDALRHSYSDPKPRPHELVLAEPI